MTHIAAAEQISTTRNCIGCDGYADEEGFADWVGIIGCSKTIEGLQHQVAAVFAEA